MGRVALGSVTQPGSPRGRTKISSHFAMISLIRVGLGDRPLTDMAGGDKYKGLCLAAHFMALRASETPNAILAA
jgi:hypothetical protein